MPRSPRRGIFRVLAPLALTAWATLGVVGGSTLMAGHLYALPEPAVGDPVLLERLHSLQAASDVEDGQWHAVHVLYAACRCSQRIFDHLFESARPAGYRETVLLVGDDASVVARARTAGFGIVSVTPQQLATEFHIEAAPLLLVLDPDGRIRYAGGYSERKQGYEALDVGIMESLASGRPASELPLYGCGVSKELQAVLDPLGLKYE